VPARKQKKKREETCSSKKLFPTNANDVAAAADMMMMMQSVDAMRRCKCSLSQPSKKTKKNHTRSKTQTPQHTKEHPTNAAVNSRSVQPDAPRYVVNQSDAAKKEKPISAETFWSFFACRKPEKKNRNKKKS